MPDGSTRSKAIPGHEFSGIVAGLGMHPGLTKSAGKQLGRELTFLAKRQITKETIPMKLTWHGHSAFRMEAGAAKILIDPPLSDNPSWDKGTIGYLAAKNSTHGDDR
jgi:hypothetical protein